MGRPRLRAYTGARPGGASAPPSRRRAFASRFSIALLLSVLPLSSPTLGAQSSEDLRRAADRLRLAQASLAPLPDSAINRDAGEIAVVEHDGTNYDDRLPDGTLNVEARARVGLRFYETHPDAYDFLVVFTNFDFKTSDATAFHLYGRNDVEGIGKPVGSIGPVVFGSPSRLKGWIDMAAVSQYRKPPYALDPGPGFARTLGVLAHEVGHQWLAEARYKVGDTVFDDLLGSAEAHWSYLLDSDGSFLYGADWRDAGGGTFAADRVRESYSALDLYLMGLLPREKVAPFTLLRNPEIDRHRINVEGEVVSATGTTTITIDQVVDAMGARRPDHLHSQKELRLGFVFLAAPGTEPSPEDLEAVERIRRAFGAHFFALTRGVGWADTSLATPPPAPRAPTLDLPRALAWLGARQGLDGSWADAPQTRERDTAAAVVALLRAKEALPAAQRGIAWLRAAQPESLDFQARVATALEPLALAAPERAARIARVLGGQNPDGGFGAGTDFASDPLDTALALRALKALQHPEDARVRDAVAGLAALANADGGWAAVAGAETSTVVTAEVLLALLDWADVPGSAALRAPGTAALLARRNPDGGFGSSPSTPYASALALEVLLRSGAGSELVDPLTIWLQRAQLADGSWASSPYQTALVIGALGQSLGPNLVVPADALVVSPSPAREGEVVRVVARVRNAGRVAAPATVARLHDGDPASTSALAEVPVPPLPPADDTEVAFDFATVDRPGPHTLYVVADAAGQVRESREDDNTASRALTVLGLLADLQVLPADIVLSPPVPEKGETVSIAVRVVNQGERVSLPGDLRLMVDDPSGDRLVLPDQPLLALAPGQAATATFTWTAAALGRHVVHAVADARFAVPETNEANNAALRPVVVVEDAPEGAELAVVAVDVAPDTLRGLPQEIEVRGLVENQGRAAAETTVAVLDGGPSGPVVGTRTLQVEPRSSVAVTVPVTVTTPGRRPLVLAVDPDGRVDEVDEANNAATAMLADARTLDLELVAADASVSPPEAELDQAVTVTWTVRNRGTVDVSLVPVQLSDASSGRELARVDVEVRAGEARSGVLLWHAGSVGEIPLTLRVDPFDLLSEQDEGDNEAGLVLVVRRSALANLVVSGTDVSISPDPPVEGGAAGVSAVVRNTGGGEAGPFVVRVFLGDPDEEGTLIGEATVAGLAPVSETTVNVPWSPVGARGSQGLFVVADAAFQVEESDESDNRGFLPFRALGLPDLVLTAADVVLDPGYPRAGEPVTILATVRNLGGQPAGATTLTIVEGEPAVGLVLGTLAVPPLEPGAGVTLSLAWTPASPPGGRVLWVEADPENLVVEQDEGNNAARRTVVVQNADLYLTEPYFSPNGDGVKDETTLAWRATVRVGIAVTNARGQRVRTLAADAAALGSATWDGRDERGVVAFDGRYTFVATGEDGRVIGRADAVLDTDRSPLHDAQPRQTFTRNLTCGLPEGLRGPAWMPGEDEALFILPYPQPGFPAGLLRVDREGRHSYVAQDAWFSRVSFASGAAVSPDGQQVLLVESGSALHVLDLAAGVRRALPGGSGTASWSPDARFILVGDTVLARDGATVAELCGQTPCETGGWAWAPSSDRLAAAAPGGDAADGWQVRIVARDGSVIDEIPVPAQGGWGSYPPWALWRGDGKIVIGFDFTIGVDRRPDRAAAADEAGGSLFFFVLDPDTRALTPLPIPALEAPWHGAWSPDGSRVIGGSGNVWTEGGEGLGTLLPWGASVSPRSSLAYLTRGPEGVCGSKGQDGFVVSSAANLAVRLEVARLPGNNGLRLSGVASDAHLDRAQIDYASQADPATWRPVGPAFDAPVVDDLLAVWVPPAPGTYVVRLSVVDRAGNTRVATRVVAWDRVPALANFTQSEYFVSPNADGAKDEVVFRYLVIDPTRLDVRIVGPESRDPGGRAAPTVRREPFDYPATGPQELTWDGRDDAGQVVPDGRYTVYLNDLPFRVEVDNTPPEVGLAFGEAAVASRLYRTNDECRALSLDIQGPGLKAPLGTLTGERLWHVVEPNLRSWVVSSTFGEVGGGTSPVFVAETGPDGLPIFDDGRPRVRRENGRPANRQDRVEDYLELLQSPLYRLEAEDHAGNRSAITAESPTEERIWVLGAEFKEAFGTKLAEFQCEDVMPPLEAEGATTFGLRPENGAFLAGAALRPASSTSEVSFRFAPREGGVETQWSASMLQSGLWVVPVDSFERRGADPTRTYRGRFVGGGSQGEVSSPGFLFSPCEKWLRQEVVGPPAMVALHHRVGAPLARVALRASRRSPSGVVELGTHDMTPTDGGGGSFFFALSRLPAAEVAQATCEFPLEWSITVEDALGHQYPDSDVPKACQRLRGSLPACPSFALRLEQTFPGCKGSPDELHLRARLLAGEPVRLDVQAGPDGAVTAAPPVIVPLAVPMANGWPYRDFVLDATACADGPVPARATLTRVSDGEVVAMAELPAVVDRTAPAGEVLAPPEGGSLCVAQSPAGPAVMSVLALGRDLSPALEVEASMREPGGVPLTLSRVCEEADPSCGPGKGVRSGAPLSLQWNVTALDSGPYELQVGFCDRSGNRGVTTRNLYLTREPPSLRALGASSPVFSPNRDGLFEDTTVTVRLSHSLRLTARVRAGDAKGPVVRTLFLDQPHGATDVAVAWDGTLDGGATAPDGRYAVVVSAEDACGGSGEAAQAVEIDTVPPQVAISAPTGGQRVSATVQVSGRAEDAHFGEWALDTACGAGPWERLSSAPSSSPEGGSLALWDTSRAPPGECRVRLAAEDLAGNRSEDVIVAVQVEAGDLLLRLAASPDIFSPNGDGRRETAALEYELARAARTWLEVRDAQGHVLRAFETGAERPAGALGHVWDGLDAEGQPVPEGDHVLWARAEDPAVSSVYEEATVPLALDRTPPTLTIVRPAPDGFVPAQAAVRGSVEDAHLAEYTITAAPAGGAPVELAHAFQNRVDVDLAGLGALAEGPHVLVMAAEDRALNRSRLERRFVVDSTPPRAAIQSPLEGAFLLRGDLPVRVSGLVGDDHLEEWTLRFGAGRAPASLEPLAQGTTGGNGLALAEWGVRHLPDGPFALVLSATDRAGLATESRVTVTLDGQPPTVALTAPADGRYLTKPTAIVGTAADANLVAWTLEAAPGDTASAFQWSPMADAREPVEDGTLAEWSPLPADGVYTLRLTARDRVDLDAAARVTVTVDTTPPAPPTGLRSTVTRSARDGHGDVAVEWVANTEADLAGYRVFRDDLELSSHNLPRPGWSDGERLEGRYVYSVVALDLAGNVSEPSRLAVLVDLTPPLVSFSTPGEGASVSGSVEVRGTAWSADDFAEYRLSVGPGTAPTSWTPLGRSSVALAGGRLGDWLALEDGPHVLALEADDTHGNRARVTRPVLVDTRPPEAPVLVEVQHPGTPPDRLVPTWQPSPSSDVAGYLVYRGGRIANAEAGVLGDLRGYLVPGLAHTDDTLPDGNHCYQIVAMDGAGNASVPSNTKCAALDNRPPRALVVRPADGSRFGSPVRVVAETPDLDVATVRLQIRAQGAPAWDDIAPGRTSPPWEATLDPERLALGPYELRAVATDVAGNTDPDPAFVSVVYGDTTAPPVPLDLVARVDGADVALSWTASAAPDFASYRVYRGGRRIAEGLTDPFLADPGLAPAVYSYAVAAVDVDGNESEPTPPAEALVYALRLEDPAWPVVGTSSGGVAGSGSRPGTTVRVLRDGSPIASAAAPGDSFRVDAVPLVPDGNVLRARGEDDAGNRSIASSEAVLISNVPPGAVEGPGAEVDDRRVTLSWPEVAESDLFGYLVSRDGERLTGTVAQETASAFEASLAADWASRAFDGNPTTTWPFNASTGEWTVRFAQPILVERVHLRFAPGGPEASGPSRYTVLASWQGRFLPIVTVRDGGRLVADHRLPAPFATSALRVVLESPGLLAEVSVDRVDAVAAGTGEYVDDAVPEGRHAYEIAAVDRYGAEGAAGSVGVAVGDVLPPDPPTGLVATPIVRDVRLTWDRSPEPDVVEYVVLRDGARIGRSPQAPAPTHLDPGLANGTYAYAVIAVDAAGHESGGSLPATAVIDVQPVPPASPVILEPTDAARPVTLWSTRADVAGAAGEGLVVALEVDGEPRGMAVAEAAFARVSEEALPGGSVALSPDGRLRAWLAGDDTIGVRGRPGGDAVFAGGGSVIWGSLVFSPDGAQLAFARRPAGGPAQIALLGLAEGTTRVLLEGRDPEAMAWSPDGRSLAVSLHEYQQGGTVLEVLDVATAARTELDRTLAIDQALRWSPDGRRLAFVRWWYGYAVDLHVLEVGSGRSTVVDEQAHEATRPAWSPDGRRLAWTTGDVSPLSVRVLDVEAGQETGAIAEPGADVLDARFDPAGRWLSYVRVQPVEGGAFVGSLRAREETTGRTVTVVEAQAGWTVPEGHDWVGGEVALQAVGRLERFAPASRFVVRDVALRPGENHLVARATDPGTQLASPDSEKVTVTVLEGAFPDLAVVGADIRTVPALPAAGRPATLHVQVRNEGQADANDVEVAVRVTGPDGQVVLDASAELAAVRFEFGRWLSLPWTPAAAGPHEVTVRLDPGGRVVEAFEDNNEAARTVRVLGADTLWAEVVSDRASYPAGTSATVTVRVANPGRPFEGVARTTVEELDGREVALLDERPVSLDYGETVELALAWGTGTTRSGRYAFRVRVRPAGGAAATATAERVFDVEPGLAVLARVRPEPATVAEGAPVAFALLAENQGANASLEGATARLRLQLEGATGPAPFETVRALPSLVPGGTWQGADTWPSASPAGRYAVRFEIERGGVVLASASALVVVQPASPSIHGTLSVAPADVLAGQAAEARVTIENRGTTGASAYPLVVDVVSGPEATVHFSVPAAVDLAAGESRALTLAIGTGAIPPGRHVVRLRGGASPATLDRSSLVVHGLVAPPSPHAPEDGARVPTAHPSLVVNDASSPEGAALTYEFALFGDEQLTQALPGATGVPETPSRTSWAVAARLAEDAEYWWRARATDGFSTSAWSAVTSFTVDAVNRPPTAPVPDTPAPGDRVASRQPTLTVRNALDPEQEPLTYEFGLAADEGMGQVVEAEAGLAEGLGLTSWTVTTVLEEDAVYYWSVRARTPGDPPSDEFFSPWSVPVSFRVDTVNLSPSAPRPLRPIGGQAIPSLAPSLVVENATDPEGESLSYRFEIDTRPELDSPARQASAELPEGTGETAWTPPLELLENTLYYWRAHASDGTTATPSALASFFVNVANEAPGAPVALDPVDGRTVGTATPTLRLRNAIDPDGDALTYEIEVRDEAGTVVAGGLDVGEGTGETASTVTTALGENQAFTWSARAGDGQLQGPWSDPAAFRVDAVAEPPTAPVPLLPANGAVVEERRPALVVENATSPDGLPLAYTFELETAEDPPTLVERVEGVAEAPPSTAWAPTADLPDGPYQWRARASDPRQDGPWSATWRFDVLVDPPPSAPTGLRAVAGDALVRLDWNASPEPDVTGYRVHRSTTAGGPYAFVAAVAVPGMDDLGLTNGVTYSYVVTAVDARAESPYSNEATARPEAPQALVAEVRYDPAVIRAECVLPGRQGHHRRDDRPLTAPSCHPGSDCPDWLFATLELPPGLDPATIEVASLRLLGSVAADARYRAIVDTDRDGLPELRVRFDFEAVAEHLSVGVLQATIVGRAAGGEVRGTGRLEVLPLSTSLRVTPRTLQRRSCGEDLLARITFAEGVAASQVDIGSVRLNGVVPAERVVRASGRELKVKFDRAAVIGLLRPGASVEVRVTGTLRGIPFVGVDHIRVIE